MFEGKNIVITGAGAGIGKALCEILLKQGASVWAFDRDEASLDALRMEAKKAGHDFHGVVGDVTAPGALEALGEKVVADSRRIDIWINNAGIAGLGEFQEISDELFDKVIDVNLRAVVRGTRVALRSMERNGAGTIVNLASVAGHIAPPFMAAYSASKHAVVGFTRSVAEELRLGGSSVKICMVSPGFVDTAIIAKGERLGFPHWLEFLLARPNDVAHEIVKGIKAGRAEIYPTLNGRLALRLHKILPRTTVRGTKLLMARSFKDLVLNRYKI